MSTLSRVLEQIEQHDTDYAARYPLVWQALHLALDAGLAAGVRIDPAEPEWPVVYINLPTGQVSWHMPQHPVAYDGHSTDEKYARVRAYVESQATAPAPSAPFGQVQRERVNAAVQALGLPTEDLRSVDVRPARLTARYLLRTESRTHPHGVVEAVVVIPIRG